MAAATDVFIINGSATKTIRVLNITFTMTTTAGSGATLNIALVKRSTANSGGTFTSLNLVPHDSANSASTATVLSYTANPTVGTLVGAIRAFRYSVQTANTVIVCDWDFGVRPSQALILRGVAQGFAINLNGGSFTGGVASIDVEFTEE